MNPYAKIDRVIDAWARDLGSTMVTGQPGQPLRFFHIPGDPPHECFQIVVFPPSNDRIVVQAAAIDTNDDVEREMLQMSEGSVKDLDALLASAVATIENWKRRHHDSGA